MIEARNVLLTKLRKYSTNVYINDIYRIIRNTEKSEGALNLFEKISAFLVFASWTALSSILIVSNILIKKDINNSKEIALARVQRTEVKIKKFSKEPQTITDNIMNKDFTIYQLGCRRQRFQFLLFRYLFECINDYKDINKIISEIEMLPYSKNILFEMAKRIPHTVVYRFAIENLMKSYKPKVLYTGQMYDRYALVESQTASKYGKYLVCIPHGVESALEMPVGYVGDKFFCTSEHMCERLKVLYNSNKYTYSSEVIERLFKVNSQNKDARQFVYFTQPTNQSQIVEIIKVISDYLNSLGIKLFLKLHPLDNLKYYESCNVEVISDFDEAINNNVCIGTASTVLLESIYNDSLPISIINVIEPDRLLDGNYEFLSDDRIIKPKGLTELIEILNENIVFHKSIKEENNE